MKFRRPHLGIRERKYLDACTASLFLLAVLAFHNGTGASVAVATGIASIWTAVVGARAYESRNPQPPADPPTAPPADPPKA